MLQGPLGSLSVQDSRLPGGSTTFLIRGLGVGKVRTRPGLGQADGAFGFQMLDDPSQSLASEHKRRLVKVLNEVATDKQLFVATMDQEFRTLLTEGLLGTKTEYAFERWTPEEGPTVTRR